MTNARAKARLGDLARMRQTCELRSCSYLRARWSPYCERHDQINERTGHPEGRTILKGTLRPYVKAARRYVDENADHPEIAKAIRRLYELVYLSRQTPPKLKANAPPKQRLERWLVKMKRDGVSPNELLAIMVAMYLLREHTRAIIKSDRHWNHQLSIRVLRSIKSPLIDSWEGGHKVRRYDRITVGVRELVTGCLLERAGTTALRAAKAILEAT